MLTAVQRAIILMLGRKAYASWSPTDKNADVTLSNRNLTATGSVANNKCVRSGVSKATGKCYWEITVTTETVANGIGVADASAVLANFLGSDVHGWGYFGNDGKAYNNGVGILLATFTTGDVIQVAVDIGATSIWWGKNGTFTGNPGAGTGATYTNLSAVMFAAACVGIADVQTANFGASAFTYTPPSGFNSGFFQ